MSSFFLFLLLASSFFFFIIILRLFEEPAGAHASDGVIFAQCQGRIIMQHNTVRVISREDVKKCIDMKQAVELLF